MVITYTEKGHGLHDKLAALGITLTQRDGVWQSDSGFAQAVIDSYTLTETQDEVCNEIEAFAAELRNKHVANISPAEMASWSIKLAEAAAFAASGDPASAPLLGIEATARGCTLADLIGKVNGNATNLAALEAAIAGTSGKHRDAVRALTTFADVLAYDWHTGWPE